MEAQHRRVETQVRFVKSISLDLPEDDMRFLATNGGIWRASREGYRRAMISAATAALAALRYGPPIVLFSLPLLVPAYRRLRLNRRAAEGR